MILFKTDRIETEWNDLPIRNQRLGKVVRALSSFCELEYRKDITLTCILRTPEENTVQGGIENSPHLVWEACDLRSRDFEMEQVYTMLSFLNKFTFRNGKQTAIYHEVPGGAPHFHIQVAK